MARVFDYIEIETPAWEVSSPMGPDVIWRFTKPTEGTPRDIDAIPSLSSISFTPATISLGENLGTRATLTAAFRDHRHIMAGEDFGAGTFWGKWRGRYGQRLRGRPLRWIRGVEGQSLDQMETWHFIIESVDGPTPSGVYTIMAQDVLKQVDDDRALAPRPTRGSLLADITAAATSFTVGPVGIGNIDYPASGYIAIGGKEICTFTRSGDTFTIARNTTVPGTTFETEVDVHKAGDRAQLCLPYIGQDPADIIADLFINYAGVDSDFIDTAAWQTETDSFLQTLYTALIVEPTGVNKLVTELVQQAGLAIWWDGLAETMRLQVLRTVPTTAATFDETKFLKGSLKTSDQPDTRISEVLTYYGLREPLKPIDQEDNYRAALLTADPTAETEYNGSVTQTIMSRWIPFGGQSVAERMSLIQLGRYRDPPRKISFDTWRFSTDVPQLGQGYQLGWTENQDMTGLGVLAPIQITRLAPQPERYSVEAEEALFTLYPGTSPGGLADRTIVISSNINNLNLRAMHDSIYPEVTDADVISSPPVTLTCVINANVIVGSASTATPAFDVGSWPIGFTPTLVINGRIEGHGGDGNDADNGTAGGTALFARHALDVEVSTGQIWGGGGGGGGSIGFGGSALGGGGAGQIPGTGNNPGTTEAGGAGGTASGGVVAGAGGGPGLAGGNGSGGILNTAGGAAGAAIDGVSFVTVTVGPGDIRGGQIN